MGILRDIIKKFSDALQDGIQDGIVKKLDHTAENLAEEEFGCAQKKKIES